MGGLQERGMSMIWAGSAFLLMGNLSSANATIYAMAADSCPPAQRSRYFYYLYSTFLVCELFAPALASLTIERNLLIPFGVGLASLLACFPILHVVPETHKSGASSPSRGTTSSRRTSTSSDKDQDQGEGDATRETDRLLQPPLADPEGEPGGARPRRSLLSVVQNRNILLALFVLFAGALRQGTVSVLLQYAAVRFGWPTSRTAMLVSVIAASNIVLFLVILPQTVAFLTSRWHVMPQIIDYNVVSASLVILTVGATLMGLASSMHWLICGRWRTLLRAKISQGTYAGQLPFSLPPDTGPELPCYPLSRRGRTRTPARAPLVLPRSSKALAECVAIPYCSGSLPNPCAWKVSCRVCLSLLPL